MASVDRDEQASRFSSGIIPYMWTTSSLCTYIWGPFVCFKIRPSFPLEILYPPPSSPMVYSISHVLFTSARYLPSASTLRSLDLSGNTELGNRGCLQVLRACRKLSLSRLSLAACGMVSPLPDTLVQMLSSFTCKIELTGNSIDSTDKLFIRSPVV